MLRFVAPMSRRPLRDDGVSGIPLKKNEGNGWGAESVRLRYLPGRTDAGLRRRYCRGLLVKVKRNAVLATPFLALLLLGLCLYPGGASESGIARATTYVPEGPLAEDQLASWTVTRATGRRTVTLSWLIQECLRTPGPEVTDVKAAWGRETTNGKFPLVITISVRTYSSPQQPCTHSGMSKRIRLARPLSKVILFDGSAAPPRKEAVPKRYSPLEIY